VHGIKEIKAMNTTAPVKNPAEEFRVQRDRLAQCLRRVLKGEADAHDMAQRVLAQIYGEQGK
jgi:hypothetical protein